MAWILNRWAEERLDFIEGVVTPTAELQADLEAYVGHEVGGNQIGAFMRRRGCEPRTKCLRGGKVSRRWVGVRLKGGE